MKTLVVAVALVAATSVAGRSTAEPQDPAATPVVTSANSALVEDIIRLWKANLSEEFINKYFARSDLARDLTADDVVRLRDAGVPETLITSITLRRAEAGTAAVAVGRAAPPNPPPRPSPLGGGGPGRAASAPKMTPGLNDSRRWDGLMRRNSGLVLLKSRWDGGFLEFKDASLQI